MKNFATLNDRTLAVYFEDVISREVNQDVLRICQNLEKLELGAIKAIQHTYHMLAVHYDPRMITEASLKELISQISLAGHETTSDEILIRIPVLYDGADLENVAKYNGLSIDEVIRIHSSNKYYVYFLGFSAGFPYLGGLDDAIATPRLKTPRVKVPIGSVGIADQQTGIYTVESPGGWNIIGRTPIKMFDASRKEACILLAGCYVEFYPIDLDTFKRLEKGEAVG